MDHLKDVLEVIKGWQQSNPLCEGTMDETIFSAK